MVLPMLDLSLRIFLGQIAHLCAISALLGRPNNKPPALPEVHLTTLNTYSWTLVTALLSALNFATGYGCIWDSGFDELLLFFQV